MLKKLGQDKRTNYTYGSYETEEPTSTKPKAKSKKKR